MYFPAILSIHEKYIKYNCCTLYHIYVYCCSRGKAKRMEDESNSDLKQMNKSTLDPPITKSKYIYKSKTIVERSSVFEALLNRFFGGVYRVVFKYTGPNIVWVQFSGIRGGGGRGGGRDALYN